LIGTKRILTTDDLSAGSGGVVKVVSTGTSSEVVYANPNTFSLSQVLSLSITPISTSNKILVRLCANGIKANSGRIRINISRSGTTIVERFLQADGILPRDQSFDFLDSPASTSAITYTFNIGNSTSNVNNFINVSVSTEPQGYTSLTLMEILP
jgi:hypothetical protein